jgi:hypothetical protein
MTDKALGNLTPRMKERLEKWRKNTLPVKSAEIFRRRSPGNYVARRMEHGDDMSDFEELHNKKLLEGKK